MAISPSFSVSFQAPLSGTAAQGGAGDVLIPDVASGLYVLATFAARGTRRSTGIATDTYLAGGAVTILQTGQIDAATAGLGAGTASWVRVSTAGRLERCTPASGDDVVGWVEANGTFHASFGYLTATIVNAGFVPPTGTGLVTVTSGALNAAALATPGAGTYALQSINGVLTWVNQVGGSPTLTALNYALADIAGGGQSIIATGTNCSTVTAVNIWGTTVTPSATTSTTVTFTAPAHAAGTTTVSLTNPSGTSGTMPFESWSPAQITGIDTYLDASKGVTGGASVSAWLDQSANARSFNQATGANQPAQTASVFGALPSIRFNGSQWVNIAPDNIAVGGTGRSYFAVMKQAASANRTTPAVAGVGNAPYQIIGDRVNGYGGLGMANGVIWDNYYTGAYFTTARGSGLNDSNPHLVGSTDDGVTNVKVYLGATQQGATNTNAAILSASTYDTIGLGYSTGDGFVGDVGAVVVVAGVISSGDLTKLNAWSQQRFATI